jgi:hypothetical protein
MCWALNHQNNIEMAQGHISLSGSRVDFAAMVVRRGILASALSIKCSEFSEASRSL